jgi:protein TonB
MVKREALAAMAVLGAVTASLPAKPVGAQDWEQEVRGWTVGRTGDGCIMAMDYAGAGATRVSLFTGDDADQIFLSVSNYGWSTEGNQEYRLAYWMGEWRHTLTSIGYRDSGRRGFLALIGEPFLRDFAASTGLLITRAPEADYQIVDDLSLAGTAAAVGVFDRCRNALRDDLDRAQRERERLAHIPIDPFASAVPALETELDGPRDPVQVNANFAQRVTEGYPSAAVRLQLQGMVGVTADVSVDGRITACRVVQSSGHAILDDATCANVTRYGRFRPASDASGNPVAGVFSTTVNYSLGGPPSEN